MIERLNLLIAAAPLQAAATAIVAAIIAAAFFIGRRQAAALWREAGDRSWLTAILSFDPDLIRQRFFHN